MRKAVLISIKPEWCERIASKRKTIELRKTKPKLKTPFKVYIYCTKGAPYLNRKNGVCYLEEKDTLGGRGPGLYQRLSGTVIGEFVCDGFLSHCEMANADIAEAQSLVRREKILEYAGENEVFGWHISDLVIYDKPKELSEFYRLCSGFNRDVGKCWDCEAAIGEEHECSIDGLLPILRPPQSWCYVEDGVGGL